jgi:predicted ATPase/signal transduction histidine kinase
MLSLPGYRITEELHAGAKTLIYRGYREHDQCLVILKTLTDDYPTQKDLSCLQHEYAITKDWDENGLLRSYALVKHQHTQVLVQEDIGGVSLNRLLTDQALPLPTFLTLAIAIARSLSRIHQCHLIHKDINPFNLVVNIKTNQVQIIDFGIATQLSRETPQMQNPGHLEGTLPYLSPEQTGRMNRALDYRTDFYSLGATFYEMLAGVPPFTTTDPMELVHCHLARTPPPLHEYRPEVPLVLCELVQKLMAKTAEARYQSAFGLIADLETCQRFFNLNASINNNNNNTVPSIPAFPLGRQDVSERFQIPQKLYGRETEVRQVLNAFERVSKGHTEMLFVAGYSGVGKTDLVHELHKPITAKNGYCIDGKFDQFQRDIPYASLIQAFQELLRQLLTESPAKITHWKSVLSEALGGIAQVIIEVIPEVAWILGPQPPVPELPPAQAQNRFNLAFQQFIRTFTTKDHPLVLFLDDLQWADLPSLQLIKLFMTDPETQYLLVIGAYRDNEVQAAHPLMLTLDEIRQTTTRLDTITLKPLNQEHIQQLVAETFYCDEQQSSALAQLCLQKTQGNPFFLSQFLRTLVETQQISFNHATGHWQWNIGQLQHTQITNNVVELMAEKIQTLPQTTQAVIQLAACIGNQFDLATLAWAWEQSAVTTAHAIWSALQEHLIAPLDETYKYIGNINQGDENQAPRRSGPAPNPTFKFVHDRVQQAAYSLIQEESKAVFHLRIGRRLLAHLTPGEREERIFDLVYQWNKGQVLVTDESEKEQLAQLNLIAGGKAKSSAAYHPALSYFQTGLQLVGESGWEKHYELTLSLYVEATQAAYLCGDFAQMDDLAAIVLQKAGTLLDRVKVYQIQIHARILQNRSLDAIKIALPVLRQLGVKLPENPTTLHILRGVLETKLALLGKSVEALSQLPPITEAEPLATMQVISSIVPAAYFATPKLVPLIACKQVYLSIKYGNTALSAYAYAGYGAILCGALGDIELGYRFGKLAVATLEHFSAKALNAQVLHLVENHVKHWKDPLHERLPVVLEAYQNGVQTGDFEYAAYVAFNYTHFLYLIGRELSGVQKELEKYAQAIVQFKQEPTLHWQKIIQQTVANLHGQGDDPCHLQGSYYDEDTTPVLVENRLAVFLFHSNKMMLCFLFQKYPQALEHALVAEQNLDGAIAFSSIPVCHFYMALVRLALFPNAPKNEQKRLLKKVASIQKSLKKWAGHAPVNNLHKWHLVEAERKRVNGDDFEAMSHYDQAITLAIKNDFPQEAALANELMARFNLSEGRERLARIYLQDAHYGYQQWGAQAKVKHLEEHHPELLNKAIRTLPTVTATTNTLRSSAQTIAHDTSTHIINSETLDLAAVMKATQAISGEIVLAHLLKKLIRIAIENAGAQHGVLLLETDGEWRIEAEGNANPDEAAVNVLQSHTFMQATDGESNADPTHVLPISLIRYVALTKETLVLDNACCEGRFVNDHFIRKNAAKSILCSPILHQGKLAGILYLANNLTEGVFTAARLEVLKIISAQAAISIENARVYENLEFTVTQRTAALSESNAALALAYTAAESARHQATEALEDLRETQTQLVQSEKMASLGHLVAGVAHELNTPIGNALTTSSLLADSTKMLKTAMDQGEMLKSNFIDFVGDAVQMADVINHSCQRAATLITSFKQVAADQTSEQRRTFDLHSLVTDNIAALSANVKGAQWMIKTEIPDGIECDSYPGPLGQVIANLVQNAAFHGFEGRVSGTLKITATVKPGDEVETNEVEMLFSDDGNGMEPAILAHIFEPFYTARPGRDQSRKQGGSGLGLSISLNIVTGVLGGTLSAASEPGCGSQFCLIFPLKAPQRRRNSPDTGRAIA